MKLPESMPVRPAAVAEQRASSAVATLADVTIDAAGCCGLKVCDPFGNCHCAGVESPFCP